LYVFMFLQVLRPLIRRIQLDIAWSTERKVYEIDSDIKVRMLGA